MKEKEFQETLAELIKSRDEALETKKGSTQWEADFQRLLRRAEPDQSRRALELLDLHDSNHYSQLEMGIV